MTSELLNATDSPLDARPRYALVVRLPRQAEARIADAYLWLPGITRPSMGYHITLLGPLLLSEGVGPEAFEAARAVCARWGAFGVQIAGLGAFENDGVNTIYLGVVECDRIVPLHRALYEALDDRIDFASAQYRLWNESAYTPHVTLSLGLDERALMDLLATNQRRAVVVDVEVTSVWLVMQGPAGAWQFLAEYTLGEEPGAFALHSAPAAGPR